MRIAFLSDIHGNLIALNAVLTDIESVGGVDAYWILGDLVADGYDPVGILERITTLPNVAVVRGNTDRYVVTGSAPKPSLEDVADKPEFFNLFVQVARSFAWTQGAITTTGWLPWLSNLPLEQRILLPCGTRVLGVHATPGEDDGPGLHPNLSQPQLAKLTHDCNADLIFAGHTHWYMNIITNGIHCVNLGSVSNPLHPDLKASYVILEAGKAGYQLYPRRVSYDHEAVIRALRSTAYPGSNYVIEFLLGKHLPGWQL